MRKAITILFLFSFLIANTAFGEVLKLPMLIHHYIEHSQEDDNHSILGFLADHYGEDTNHHDNQHEHDNLPFKTESPNTGQTFCLPPSFIETTKLVPIKELKTLTFQEQNYSNIYLDSIWQPPKFS